MNFIINKRKDGTFIEGIVEKTANNRYKQTFVVEEPYSSCPVLEKAGNYSFTRTEFNQLLKGSHTVIIRKDDLPKAKFGNYYLKEGSDNGTL